ncbi:hypothetical protein DPMN_030535 [Dreissena polymorpha]|uniref:G protein gamma domain-containing protein n=1 Tax=Dreissena polymorpha TaxID=45954 RepID=A0A9D4M0J8_DREPO|nr:hypothetical protein DPMN_030535 [Dreissena polymorpha]
MQQEIKNLRETKKQLQEEAKVKPMKVSQALSEMMVFIETNKASDKLVTGFSNNKENPWVDGGAAGGNCLIM